ncbi:hypothetical protein HMPREF9123_1075 [Neisseria bacilliformis ATCC BAA-1200]|uniref:Uncharacterized protein n=1 Tax=Neisseria bacilliformis ATCC BAA-1200 TaxID=888742 RepID=F2BBH0_9NEIS|nr:hypothetical protein HMPREF9123_1075 [Neisseria bacilliformis ATCC BAA-1200]
MRGFAPHTLQSDRGRLKAQLRCSQNLLSVIPAFMLRRSTGGNLV